MLDRKVERPVWNEETVMKDVAADKSSDDLDDLNIERLKFLTNIRRGCFSVSLRTY